MRHLRVALFVIVWLLPACDASELPSGPTRVEAIEPLPVVTRVIDGDTIVVEGIGTVRLIGVDTPETVDPRRPVEYFGKEASDFTTQLAAGKQVRLEFDRDRTDGFGRTLAYVYLHPEDLLLNAEIIRQGYGVAYTRFPFRMMERFRALEREAREAERGLWAAASGSALAVDADSSLLRGPGPGVNPLVSSVRGQSAIRRCPVYRLRSPQQADHDPLARHLSWLAGVPLVGIGLVLRWMMPESRLVVSGSRPSHHGTSFLLSVMTTNEIGTPAAATAAPIIV